MNLTYTKKCLPLLMFLLFGISYASFGQEGHQPDYDQTQTQRQQPSPAPARELGREGDSFTFPDNPNLGEGRTNGGAITVKESTASVPDTASAATLIKPTVLPQKAVEKKPQSPQDESVLSFNFLYYIIQRFKLSEIIE